METIFWQDFLIILLLLFTLNGIQAGEKCDIDLSFVVFTDYPCQLSMLWLLRSSLDSWGICLHGKHLN